MTTDTLLSTKQVAEYLNVDNLSVRTYIKNGWLKAHKLGNGKNGVWRIKNSDLQEFINCNSNIGE